VSHTKDKKTSNLLSLKVKDSSIYSDRLKVVRSTMPSIFVGSVIRHYSETESRCLKVK
jgi:hypothetical protein